MGWKAVRDHYRIGHIVQRSGDDLLIGSGYVSDLVRITPEGGIVENRIFRREGELGRYVNEMEADKALLLSLMASEDVFERSIPVYGWSGATIVEDACEEVGWPNVTHSGALMYDNAFFLDRDDAVRHAVADARSGIDAWTERVEEAEADLEHRKANLERVRRNLAHLTERHPTIVLASVGSCR